MVVSLCGLFKVDTVFVVSVESPLTSCALSALGRLTSPAGRHGDRFSRRACVFVRPFRASWPYFFVRLIIRMFRKKFGCES